jgi:hypothetical protein
MSQEFIKELERQKAKQAEQGGFNAPAPVAPGMQPQAPQELSTPEFGPTLANEAQLPVEQRTQDGTMIGVPDFNEPYIIPEAAQAFGDVPVVEKPSMIDSAIQGFKDQNERMAQSSYSPMGGVSTPSTAVKNVSGFGGAVEEIGGEALGNLSDEAIMNRMAVSQGKPIETPSVVSDDPFGVTPEQIAAAGNENFGKAVAENPYRSQYGVNSLDQKAIDEIQQQDAAAPQAQLPSTIQNAGGQNLAGFKPKYEGQSLTDFMAGRDDPSAASVQVQDPQGRFRRQAAPVAGETPEQKKARTDSLFPEQAAFEQKSADREARQAARPDFGEAVSDRERRAARGDDMSDADRRDIAKANQRGASASDIARGDKVAAANGIDRKTGKPLEGDGLTFDQQLKLRSQKFNEGKFEYEITKDAKELYDKSLTEAKEAQTAEAKAESVGRGLASSVADMRDVMGRASGRLDGFFSTDMVGKAASFWKGSDADAQEADFAFLKSNVALNAMMELKANSPTGSTGFGALNTEELKVLTNQFATLDPFTDSKLVRQNLKQLNERFEGIIQNAYNTHAAEYGKEAADGVYGSMMGGKQAQGQSNQAPSGKSVTTANGRFTATAVID